MIGNLNRIAIKLTQAVTSLISTGTGGRRTSAAVSRNHHNRTLGEIGSDDLRRVAPIGIGELPSGVARGGRECGVNYSATQMKLSYLAEISISLMAEIKRRQYQWRRGAVELKAGVIERQCRNAPLLRVSRIGVRRRRATISVTRNELSITFQRQQANGGDSVSRLASACGR